MERFTLPPSSTSLLSLRHRRRLPSPPTPNKHTHTHDNHQPTRGPTGSLEIDTRPLRVGLMECQKRTTPSPRQTDGPLTDDELKFKKKKQQQKDPRRKSSHIIDNIIGNGKMESASTCRTAVADRTANDLTESAFDSPIKASSSILIRRHCHTFLILS